MDEAELEDLVAILPPLLHAMDALEWIGRRLNPPDLAEVVAAVGTPDAPLRDLLPRLARWPAPLADVRGVIETAGAAVQRGFDMLRESLGPDGDMRMVHRAVRRLPEAQEALYNLSAGLAPVSRYFLEPDRRDDAELQRRLTRGAGREGVGVFHVENETGSRGGFSLYVPEYYSPDTAWPLVMALHGGGGNGRAFFWTWLRTARSHGAILVAPTAIGQTWALRGDDPDTPNLARILEMVRTRWNLDPGRLLLTGMSDGGTFTYTSGLEPESPFTHLAPVAAAFHPMLAQMADPERMRGLPVHIAHGALDWMFPIEMARAAQKAIRAAGAAVTYREIDDLAHCYPRELNPDLLAWLNTTPTRSA